MQVCMESRVESIIPDYPKFVDNSSEVTKEDTVDCSKLILTEPYNGEDYSIVLKRRTSTTDMYNIISRVEIERLKDESLIFEYHHAARKGRVITFRVTMNVKALELVSNIIQFMIWVIFLHIQICKEPKIKLIKPNYDTSVIN